MGVAGRTYPSRCMGVLTDLEQDCLRRFCALLEERLGEQLVEVRLFGSAARGEMWPAHSPMHSDIDLLVVIRGEVGEEEEEAIVNETYSLYLECGRQISPSLVGQDRLAEPDERTRALLSTIERDAVRIWPTGDEPGGCGDPR